MLDAQTTSSSRTISQPLALEAKPPTAELSLYAFYCNTCTVTQHRPSLTFLMLSSGGVIGDMQALDYDMPSTVDGMAA
jgi:hypothetical protein